MVILGLGSNLKDSLENLRKALHLIETLPEFSVKQISPVYISDALLPDNAPLDWNKPYLNLALRCETTLKPQELLPKLKQIEKILGREPTSKWGPRIIDIDILAWDELIIQNEALTIPHQHLEERPFALWPLADVAPFWKFPLQGSNQHKTAAQMVEAFGSRFSGHAPFRTRQINQRIDAPQLVGIINVTPDSYSDGGFYLAPEKALEHAIKLVENGAEILDIGAESTSPSAIAIDAKEEWQRLEPVLSILNERRCDFLFPPKISIDTYHAEVAKKALAYDIHWINDVSGLDDPIMREIIAENTIECVMMHHLSIPERRDNILARDQNPVTCVYEWAKNRLHELDQQGISLDKIIFDPGIGFGKEAEQSLFVLKNIDLFQSLGVRLLVGPSRKTFLSLVTNHPFAERDVETMAIAAFLSQHCVDFLRVHHVEWCTRTLRVMKALQA